VFLLIWEVTARTLASNQALFPPFSAVMEELVVLVKNGMLWENFRWSLMRVLIGFTAGSLSGIFMGVLLGSKRVIFRSLHPIFSLLYPVPTLGWIPVFMLWFGIGEILPIALLFVCAFFPIYYNTETGIRTVGRDMIHAARTLGAGNYQILKTIVIPLALPSIFTGLRLEAGMAWRTTMAAEMIAIPTGIGALLMKAETLIRMDIVIVCLIVLSVMGFSFERFFLYLEKKTTGGWR
jgi:ABC-type nitrate/sulfonate/bicarbonate transport system permease component